VGIKKVGFIVEANKLIAKKLKEGYLEQEEIFIRFYNEAYFLYPHCAGGVSKIDEVLAEIDKQDKPFVISYGFDELVTQLDWFFYVFVKKRKIDVSVPIANMVYHLPKFEAANEAIADNFLSFYGVGLKIAAFQNDEKLENFCRSRVPAETANEQLNVGFAYSAARRNNVDDLKKYLNKLGPKDLKEFKHWDFCRKHWKIMKECACTCKNKEWADQAFPDDEAWTCTACGTDNASDAAKCNKCGKVL
jgi:hypothetical protein